MLHEVDGIAFVTYETPLTPCGGIAAVMKYLPQAIQRAAQLRTVVLTPFHHQMRRLSELLRTPAECLQAHSSKPSSFRLRGIASINGDVTTQMHLWQCVAPELAEHSPHCEWVFLLPDEPDVFAGRRHPYDVSKQGGGERDLLSDALLFGAAIPKALHLLGPGMRWAVVMQDWEGATAALALSGRAHGHSLFLTLHNSYDSGAVTDDMLLALGGEPSSCPADTPDGTVLSRALPLMQRPLLTVSQGFAQDLRQDPFQREVMTPHLQKLLAEGTTPQLVGIDNGPFAEPSIPEDVMAQSRRLSARSKQGNRPLRHWKRARRLAFQEALQGLLAQHSPRQRSTRPMFSRVWGGMEEFLEYNANDRNMETPWFVMGGRDDARQKGYDVAAEAARTVLSSGVDACFLWFPIPGEEGLHGLQFLSELAWEFPNKVLVFPFFFREGYMAALQGATYALMPSFYEPFGAANEFYLQGTVGIGRATGGLVQQIVPLRERDGEVFWPGAAQSVVSRTRQWHAKDAAPTGLLFREPDAEEHGALVDDWRGINNAGYQEGQGDRLSERRSYAVWREMVTALEGALLGAIDTYLEHPLVYDQMLLDGSAYIEARFSWQKTAELYLQVIAPRIAAQPPNDNA